jgi:phosphate transport system protein
MISGAFETGHISSAFDRDLETIQALIMKMGGMVEVGILQATDSVAHKDIDLAARVRRNDRLIDTFEEQINQEAARIIATRAPTAGDLRAVLTAIKIASNLERVGDYAKNISKRNAHLVKMPEIEGATSAIKLMSNQVQVMLSDALDAFVQRDAELAQDVRLRDREVDQMYNSLFLEFINQMTADQAKIEPSLHFHFIAKNLERIGDHVTNIAEQVIYLVRGKMPDDNRYKDDSTSFYHAE